MFIQQLINGLAIGSVYALMTVGYSLIYSLMSFSNFAHGVVVMLSAYVGYFVMRFFAPSIPLGIVACAFGGMAISVLIEILTYRVLLLRNAKRTYLCIAGLGLSIMAENLVIVALSGRFKSYPNSMLSLGSFNIGKVSIGIIDVIILGVSLVALLGLELYINKGKDGLAIRGAAFSLENAQIMGINTDTLMIKVFAIAGALAGIAGFFCGIKYTAYPKLGSSLTNKAFISAVLGGLGSLPGAIVGSFILGVLEVMVAGYISSAFRDVFSYALLILILFVRPMGLLGKSSEDKA